VNTPDPESRQRAGPESPPGLEHLAVLSHLLDRAFRIPGTRWRFGLDPLIGLIPGLGDVVGSLVGAYGLWLARQLGAPGAVQARMVMNLAVDGIAGLVPLLGDLFDFAFKAHSRNQALLQQWLRAPHQTRRKSSAVLVVGAVVLLALLGGAIWVLVTTLRWVAAQLPA
jgi:hypothetical protein